MGGERNQVSNSHLSPPASSPDWQKGERELVPRPIKPADQHYQVRQA